MEIPRGWGGGAGFKSTTFKGSMRINWNFWSGWGFQTKKPSMGGRGGMDIFWNSTINGFSFLDHTPRAHLYQFLWNIQEFPKCRPNLLVWCPSLVTKSPWGYQGKCRYTFVTHICWFMAFLGKIFGIFAKILTSSTLNKKVKLVIYRIYRISTLLGWYLWKWVYEKPFLP